MKKCLTTLTLLFFTILGFTQTIEIDGEVVFFSGIGVPFYPVDIMAEFPDSSTVMFTEITDENGQFNLILSGTPNGLLPSSIVVSIVDCNGFIESVVYTVTPNTVLLEPVLVWCTDTFFDSCQVAIVQELTPAGGFILTALNFTADSANFIWSTGDVGSSIVTTEPGTYCVTMTAGDSCVADACQTVLVDTSGFCFGWIDIQPDSSGGYVLQAIPANIIGAGHQFLWDTGDTTQAIYVIEEGTYCVTITDANGCVFVTCVDVFAVPDCWVDILCDPPGSLNAWAYGNGPFTYQWDTGDTTQVIFPTAEGEYCVTVTDADGCVATGCAYYHDFNFDSCFALVFPVFDSLTGGGGFQLSVFAFGTAPYSYVWNTGETTETITATDPNVVYCVTVTDATGCEAVACNDPINLCTSHIEVDYTAAGNAVLTVSGNPLNPAVSFVWDDGTVGASITVTESGTYCVEVTHADSCVTTACVDVFLGGGFDSCFTFILPHTDSTAGGLILEAISLGTPPFTYTWNTGDTTPVITVGGLNTVYCVTVTDATGCSFEACSDPWPNLCFAYIDITYDPNSISGTLTAHGGNPAGVPLDYMWSTGELTQSITVDSAGDYCVSVTYADGCVAEACITFIPGFGDTTATFPLFGFIMNEDGDPMMGGGTVYAYAFGPDTSFLSIVDSTEFDSGGYYFEELPFGVYLVKAVADANPNGQDYFPTYHYDAVEWEEALPVLVPNILTVTTDIVLQLEDSLSGGGIISGGIVDEDNIAVSLPVEQRGDGDLDHIEIMLMDAAGTPIQFTYTDVLGHFSFTDLPWGVYFLRYEVTGLASPEVRIVLSPDQPHHDGAVLELQESFALANEETQLDATAITIAPNPTIGLSTIMLELPDPGDVHWKLINAYGAEMSGGVTNGQDNFTVDLDNGPAGLYLLQFQQGRKTLTKKLMKQ